jgi:hypothetical protein
MIYESKKILVRPWKVNYSLVSHNFIIIKNND